MLSLKTPAPKIQFKDLSSTILGKKNIFTCKVWKETEDYCNHCKTKRRCLESQHLKDERWRMGDPRIRSMETALKILLQKKEAWLMKRKTRNPDLQMSNLVNVRGLIASLTPLRPPPLPPLPPLPHLTEISHCPIPSSPPRTVLIKIEDTSDTTIQPPMNDYSPWTLSPHPSPSLSITPVSSPMPISPPLPFSPSSPSSPSSPLTFAPSPSSPRLPTPTAKKPKTTADSMIMNQNLPRLTKRKKRLNLEPLRKPGYKDFAAALQNRSPELFKVMQSQAEGAGHGLYFNGTCYANELLAGYGGERKEITKGADSHYSAKLGISRYAIDATKLNQSSRRGNYDSKKYSLGHMVNRPPTGGRANCKFTVTGGVLFVAAKRAINTQNEWIELYVPYNDSRV